MTMLRLLELATAFCTGIMVGAGGLAGLIMFLGRERVSEATVRRIELSEKERGAA